MKTFFFGLIFFCVTFISVQSQIFRFSNDKFSKYLVEIRIHFKEPKPDVFVKGNVYFQKLENTTILATRKLQFYLDGKEDSPNTFKFVEESPIQVTVDASGFPNDFLKLSEERVHRVYPFEAKEFKENIEAGKDFKKSVGNSKFLEYLPAILRDTDVYELNLARELITDDNSRAHNQILINKDDFGLHQFSSLLQTNKYFLKVFIQFKDIVDDCN